MELDCTFGEYFQGGRKQLRVIGVYSHGVYFRDGEDLFMLCDASYGRIAFGIGVDGFERAAAQAEFCEGQVWNYEGDRLAYGSRIFRGKPSFREDIKKNGCLRRDVLEEALQRRGRGVLKDLYADGSAKGDVAEKIRERLPRLLRGLTKNDGALIGESVSGLVGLGNGLTPDMDDFLFGMLYAFREKGKPPGYRDLERAVKGALHGTTVFSQEFLKCALRGGEFEAVTGVLRDMGNREKIEKLIGVGHSSGSSICVGILTAVRSIGVGI